MTNYQIVSKNNGFSARVWLSLLLLTGVLLFLPSMVQAQTPDELPAVVGGRAGWGETCLPCHGPTGQGDGPTAQEIEGPLPDFSDPEFARQLVPVENFETIKNGRLETLMPPWGDELSDAEIWNKAAYVWSLSTTPEKLAAGQTVYLEQCAACHGEGGAGDGPEAAAEMVAFANLEAMVERSQADLHANFVTSSGDHAEFDLSDEELWDTLDYIRTFSFRVPERNGIISGQVVNATTNQPQGNVELMLHGFQDDTEVITLATKADETGNFTFDKLPNDHTLIYVVEGVYQDIAYMGDAPGVFVPDEGSEANIDVKVFDTTTDDAVINITQMHYLLSFSPDTVGVIQVFVVGNNSDQTFVGENGKTFEFAFPNEASNVTFQNNPGGARFIETETGYADTEPIMPSEEGLTIAALYEITFSDDSLTIEIPIPDDVDSVDVLMNNQNVELSSDQVQFVENRDFQGNTFALFDGDNLSQGDMLTLNLTGLDDLEFAAPPDIPEHETVLGSSNGLSQDTLLWITLGIGGVAIVLGGVVYPMTRSKQLKPDISEDDVEARRQRLLLTLARLDQVFEAGELDEEVYHRARTRYKAELVELMGLAG